MLCPVRAQQPESSDGSFIRSLQGLALTLLRVVLADQHRQALRALKLMLQEEPGMEMVGAAEDVEVLLSLVPGAKADLVLLDRKLLGRHAKELISNLHTLKPRPIVVIMSANGEDGRIMLQAGADAFVSKGDQPDWLLETLRYYTRNTKDLNEVEQDANSNLF